MPQKSGKKTTSSLYYKNSDRTVNIKFVNLTVCSQLQDRNILTTELEDGWIVLREIDDYRKIDDECYVLANDHQECTRRAQEILRNYQKINTLNNQKITTLERADEQRQLLNNISQCLRWFANNIVLSELKRIYRADLYIQDWSDFTECLHYLGPFVQRNDYQREIQECIDAIVDNYNISSDQWLTLYAINKRRNTEYHRPVTPQTFNAITNSLNSLGNQRWEQATSALVRTLQQRAPEDFTTMFTHRGRRDIPQWIE